MARLASSNTLSLDRATSVRPDVTNLAEYKKTRLVRFEETRLGRIKVVGIGGAGGAAVDRLIEADVRGVEFIVVNTDLRALRDSRAPVQIPLVQGVGTPALRASRKPEFGKQAALENADRLLDALKGADIVIVSADFGDGIAAGAAPVIGSLATQLGAFTIALVIPPARPGELPAVVHAQTSIEEMLRSVDCVIQVPTESPSAMNAIPSVDELDLGQAVLMQTVQSISNVVALPGLINIDIADVKAVMQGRRVSLMGFGAASGENRAIEAVRRALSTPLIREATLKGAVGLVVNVTGSSDVALFEVCDAMGLIHDSANAEADIIFGCAIDERLSDEIRITVIATQPASPTVSTELGSVKSATLLEDFSAEFDSMIARMQSSISRNAMKTAFDSSPRELGRSAIKAARKRHRH